MTEPLVQIGGRPYGPREQLAFVEHVARDDLRRVRALGLIERRGGARWADYSHAEIATGEAEIVSQDRAQRETNDLAGRLRRVLPERMGGVAALLTRGHVEFILEGGFPLQRADVERVKRISREILQGFGTSRSDRDWLAGRLRRMNPSDCYFAATDDGAAAVAGGAIGFPPMSTAVGSWPARPAERGTPTAAIIASVIGPGRYLAEPVPPPSTPVRSAKRR